MEALEAEISMRFSGNYKKKKTVDSCIQKRESEIESSERFFIQIRQTDVVQKDFNV
jgi:hypothetical protein